MVEVADDGDGVVVRESSADSEPDGLAQRIDRRPWGKGPIWNARPTTSIHRSQQM
jgi:hypothetical protein